MECSEFSVDTVGIRVAAVQPRAPIVTASRMAVVRSRVPLLHDMCLSIGEGECLAVVGPNGAGKSTLLKCLAGAIRPDFGDVQWFDRWGRRCGDARQQIGFAGHEHGLYPELTPLENLLFAGRMYGVADPRQRAVELLASAGMEAKDSRLIAQLSQGMRQRLAIARATIHRPRLILLDEPFASLDERGREWLESLFADWCRVGQAVCFVSHDIRHTRRLADRLVFLDAGCIARVEATVHSSNGSLRSA